MRIAGGVIALIAGIFGFVAAIVTLFFGGVGAAFSAHGADTVLRLGWGGIAFSFLVIVYGACVLSTKGRWAGYLLIISAIGGWFLGGLLVGICMVLALIGGVLSLFQVRSEENLAKQSKVAIAVAILPLLIVAALSAESVYEAKHPVDGSESATKVMLPAATEQSAASPASSASTVGGGTNQVSCKSIPDLLWNAIQGSDAISRGVTGCDDVNFVSHGDIDGDGKQDIVAIWSSESSCVDIPDEPSGSCGNHVAEFISVQLNSGKIIQPTRVTGATGLAVVPGGLDVQVLKYGPDDPHCCPSVKAVEHFRLQGGMLVSSDAPANPSVAASATSVSAVPISSQGVSDLAYSLSHGGLTKYDELPMLEPVSEIVSGLFGGISYCHQRVVSAGNVIQRNALEKECEQDIKNFLSTKSHVTNWRVYVSDIDPDPNSREGVKFLFTAPYHFNNSEIDSKTVFFYTFHLSNGDIVQKNGWVDHTAIQPDNPIYSKLTALSIGQSVQVSGTMNSVDVDYESGKIIDVNFTLTSIDPM